MASTATKLKRFPKARAKIFVRFYDSASGKTIPDIMPLFLDQHGNKVACIDPPVLRDDGYVGYPLDTASGSLLKMKLDSPKCYELVWTNLIFLHCGTESCCNMEVPVRTVKPTGEIARLQMYVSHGGNKPAADVPVSVNAVQQAYASSALIGGFSQTRKTAADGCVHFCLDAGYWYRVAVLARGVQPCEPAHFFACAGQELSLTASCEAAVNRKVTFRFLNGCGELVSTRFVMEGREYCTTTGEYTIQDLKSGMYRVNSLGQSHFTPNEITVGSANEQTITFDVQPPVLYGINIEVENIVRAAGKARISLFEPSSNVLLQAVDLDQQGKALFHVPDSGPYSAVLQINDEVIQTQSIVALPLN